MKAIGIYSYGGPEVLELTEIPVPEIKDEEVLIRTHVASVNPVDWKSRKGNLKFLTGKNFPFVPGAEVSGVVEKTGKKVENLRPGDRVYAGLSYKGGGYAEFVKVNARKVFLVPDNTDFVTASTYGVAGVTALQGLVKKGKLEEGMDVLINGASGGVGSYAVQIAKIMGATVTAVCSGKNTEFVKSLGADLVIDYTKKDFSKDKETYDIIFDAVGKRSFHSTKNALKRGGIYVNPNPRPKLFLVQLYTSLIGGKKAKGIMIQMLRDDLKWVRDQVGLKKIKVHIDRVYDMTEAVQAHHHSESGRVKGKIVIKFKD